MEHASSDCVRDFGMQIIDHVEFGGEFHYPQNDGTIHKTFEKPALQDKSITDNDEVIKEVPLSFWFKK